MAKVLLVTPPFTQLNTPYPATAYLKGYLNTIGVDSHQCDLGIELINALFSKDGLEHILISAEQCEDLSENAHRILALKDHYIAVVDNVIGFLQNPGIEDAYLIVETDYLPHGSRFAQLDEMDWLFGSMGIMDKAKHLCTLFLEDLSDFITETVDPHFGFSRYAERLGRSALSFDPLSDALNHPLSLNDEVLVKLLEKQLNHNQFDLVAVSIPFPGNLFGALRIGQWIKKEHPQIKVCFGGGYVNTELRALKDKRVFDYTDFIILDDGEMPLGLLIDFIDGKKKQDQLHRTFIFQNEQVQYLDLNQQKEVSQDKLGVPDYSDLPLDKYLSVVEVANPMLRLWSDGKWLKLTLAHGCYWGKCTFCDGSLDYIGRYEPNSAIAIVDRMTTLMKQTGLNGFHFVDEAAPPGLLKEVALEILRRQLKVTWWTNIRFERSFTEDVCRLLKRSGCIAVSGGLEVASNRILKLINKGVDIAQVARVTSHFKAAGIMVHAYLMYGFPTQTAQETVDSLEVVRQLFELELVTSAFWHQFAMTAHSDVGLNPDKYKVQITGGLNGNFANNDLLHIDPLGAPHEMFGEGLKKALYNYMHGYGLDWSLNEWFEFRVPQTQLPPNYLEVCLKDDKRTITKSRWVWTGPGPIIHTYEKKKGKKMVVMHEMVFYLPKETIQIKLKENLSKWLQLILPKISYKNKEVLYTNQTRESYQSELTGDFDIFLSSYTFKQLQTAGLLLL